MLQRKRANVNSTYYLKQNPEEAAKSLEEIQSSFRDKTTGSGRYISNIVKYSKTIFGSPAYWTSARGDLDAIVEEKDVPTIFFTLSCADLYWPDLHDLFTKGKNNLIFDEKAQNLKEYPHIVDKYFTLRFDSFLKHWIKNILEAEWEWHRYEFQRGRIHGHGVAKLKNAPNLCKLTEVVQAGHIIREEIKNGVIEADEESEQLMKEADEAEKIVCTYADWLVHTWNTCPASQGWIPPTKHAAEVRHEDIPKHRRDVDYANLLNQLQIHSKCTQNTCLRKKPGDKDFKCRYGFPKEDNIERTRIEFEKIHSTRGEIKYSATIKTRRNDGLINSHSRMQLLGWRANVDIQLVINRFVCLTYMLKYTSKAEKESKGLKDLMRKVITETKPSMDSTTANLVRRMMIKACGNRDYGPLEVSHHINSIPLHKSTVKVEKLNLDGFRKIPIKHVNKTMKEKKEIKMEAGLMDFYSKRREYKTQLKDPQIMDLNLIEFCHKYSIKRKDNTLVNRDKEVVFRIFPNPSLNPLSHLYGDYCKFSLIKYKPWEKNIKFAWGTLVERDEILIKAWEHFLKSELGKSKIPDFGEKLTDIRRFISQMKKEVEEEEEVKEEKGSEEDKEEWMHLAEIISKKVGENILDSIIEEKIDYCDQEKYSENKINEISKWLIYKQKGMQHKDIIQIKVENEEVDINILNRKQRLAYNILEEHFNKKKKKEGIKLIVTGTGKSTFIKAAKQLLGEKVRLAASTGKAAFNINGLTIHSLLSLPVKAWRRNELNGASLINLQERTEGMEYLVIEQTSLAWIDSRC